MYDRSDLTTYLRWVLLALPLALTCAGVMSAQTTVYPGLLYRGQNVLTFTRPGGIERIEVSSTRYIIADRSTGILPDCPDTVNIEVTARSVTNDDQLQATIYGCDGSVETKVVDVEKWTILQEFTGAVPLRSDTCLQCRIESFSLPPRVLDTITVTGPEYTVHLMTADAIEHVRGPNGYQIQPGVPFYYQVCYESREIGYGTDTILLHFRRTQPNGGYETYTIAKLISWAGVNPPGEDIPPEVDISTTERPVDPTAFRNILVPTARSMEKGRWFYGNYLVAGHLAGYGATDRLMLLVGGSFVPDFISRFYLGTVGARYELFRQEKVSVAVGAQLAFSSVTDSDIRTFAPYGVFGYGDERSRITVAAGYGFKRHVTPFEAFDRNAFVFGIGAGTEIDDGWKINAELATIESSGILPLLLTGRRFWDDWAIDFGFGMNLSGESGVSFNDALSGEIENFPLIPYLSAMWVF